ncbi:MAG TPA: stage 0 sporulation protein [Anaerolineae bacterium]|nr:stage 0 sporulation protein [Anaerolineae bacterium]
MGKKEQITSPAFIVGVKFSKIGKNYNFDASHLKDLKIGDFIVVQTSRGWQLGEVAETITDIKKLERRNYKKVNRRATPVDLIKKQELNNKQEKAYEKVVQVINDLGLSGIKLITAEYNFDEKGITFLYSSEADEIKKFNDLQRHVQKEFNNIKITFHKIGPRDVAKFYGGMGACGMATRCCAKFLVDFKPISIRMAKTQGISLAPSEITGMCNRLRCCLNYEYCNYIEAIKKMPKKNRKILTPKGEGKVKELMPLRKMILVEIPEVGIREFSLEEIKPVVEDRKIQYQEHKKRRSKRQR